MVLLAARTRRLSSRPRTVSPVSGPSRRSPSKSGELQTPLLTLRRPLTMLAM
jgi:hypothetical protein